MDQINSYRVAIESVETNMVTQRIWGVWKKAVSGLPRGPRQVLLRRSLEGKHAVGHVEKVIEVGSQ